MSENNPQCPHCIPDRALGSYHPQSVFSTNVTIALFVANFALSVQIIREMMASGEFFVSSLVLVVASLAIMLVVVSKVVWNLFFGYIIVLTFVEDTKTGESEYHVHTKRQNDKWLDKNDWFHDSSIQVRAVVGVMYGGGFRRLFFDPLANVTRKHEWNAYPGKKAGYIVLDPGDNIGLHVPWRQALKIADRTLSYSALYESRRETEKERDALGVELVGAIDFIADTIHSVGRSKPAGRKRKELEAFMVPYQEKYEKRWMVQTELKLRRDQVPTEPDLRGSDLDIVDDESGFFLESQR